MANLARKITIATVANKTRILECLMDWRKPENHGSEVMPVCLIYGTASTFRVGVNKATGQEFVKFQGMFRTTDLVPDGKNEQASGESHDGGECILPNFLNGPIIMALKESGGNVTFGFAVGAHYDTTAATSYVFDIKTMQDPNANTDPFAAIETSMGVRTAGAPALAGPQTAAPDVDTGHKSAASAKKRR